jgi:hypothetical protein
MSRFFMGFLLLVLPSVSLAHEIGIEIKLKESEVQVVVFFEDDTPAQQAQVTLKNEIGKVLLEGKTNDKGVWSFPTPKAGKYRLEANAGEKHQAKTTFTIPPPK